MSEPNISRDSFKLPFMRKRQSRSAEELEERLPEDAIFLGAIDAEIESWTTWKVDDRYYLIPLSKGEYEWALVRISWEDNWSRYEWCSDARGSGFKGPRDAAKAAVKALFTAWNIDLDESCRAPYRRFLKTL